MENTTLKTLIFGQSTEYMTKIVKETDHAINYSVMSDWDELSDQLQGSKGDIGCVLLELDIDILENIDYLMTLSLSCFQPEFVFYLSSTDQIDSSKLTSFMNHGFFGFLEFPSIPEKIIWMIRKSLYFYNMRVKVFDGYHEDANSEKAEQFNQFILKRKKDNLPIKDSEIKLFYPVQGEPELSLSSILELLDTSSLDKESNVSVLLVEDEEVFSDYYKSYFENKKFKVNVAQCGVEALEIIDDLDSLDLVLLDIGLNDIPGNKLIPSILGKFPFSKVIILTAYNHYELMVNCIGYGAYDFVVKTDLNMALFEQKIIQSLHTSCFESYLEKKGCLA